MKNGVCGMLSSFKKNAKKNYKIFLKVIKY